MDRDSPMKPLLRILLVEDDPVSQRFLAEAIAALPADVDCAASIAQAMTHASQVTYDLWLIDANLPDGSGISLLRQLREEHPDSPALAHTASREREILDGLIDAGFAEVLVKPMSAPMLQAAIRRALGLAIADSAVPQRCGKLPSWDDAIALAALNGQREHVTALRTLFLDELPGQRMEISDCARTGDAARVRAIVHRLLASCGFVGAARLAEAVRELDADPLNASALQHVDDAIGDLLIP